MSERVSVTEVRNALRCPRIFALGRLNEKAVAFPVGSSCLGATFHRLVERFAQGVDVPPRYFRTLKDGSSLDDLQDALNRWLLGLLHSELMADEGYQSIPGEVDDLAEALREYGRHLAGRIRVLGGVPFASLASIVHSGEREIEASWPDGPFIHGRLDAIFRGKDGQLEIIEYKLTDEANNQLDQAQSVLYQQLFLISEKESATASVLRFTPILRESTVSESVAKSIALNQLDPLLKRLVTWAQDPSSAPPTDRRDLCATCPVSGACAEHFPARFPRRDDPPVAATRPRSSRKSERLTLRPPTTTKSHHLDQEGMSEARQIRDLIVDTLGKLGASATSRQDPIVGPRTYLIEVTRQHGSVSLLDRAASDVQHRLAGEQNIELQYERSGGKRTFTVTRKTSCPVYLEPLLEEKCTWLAERPGRFIVGQEPTGKILVGDFSDGSTAHLLVGGQTGSGKSVFLQSLLASLVQFHGPESIRFNLVDPKRVTFTNASFNSSLGAHLQAPISFDAEDTLPLIQQLVDLMEERYALFAEAQVTDILEFNEANPRRILERRLLVIDEFQDLLAEKEQAKEFCLGIKRLGAKARAAGIHLVLATQRPDREAVPSSIKANLTGRIAFQVASSQNSRIILDRGGAEKLLGQGDMYASLGRGLVRAQAALLSAE
jgi:S-DNA-T family DNA segregation ATPase FtsK/SpoIIIE